MARILVIEDELPMRTVLHDCLARHGYRVILAQDGEAGLQKAIHEKPDLILLDLMLPKIDGFALCAELRQLGHRMPILMLTAKGSVEDRVGGLEAGADDYLVKPFSREEMLARVRALLRRTERATSMPERLQLGDARIDFVQMRAWRAGQPLHLTSKEFGVLRLLAEAAGAPVSRERFLDVVWGYGAFPTTRTIDKHVAGLRAKIEVNPEQPRWIHTVHTIGYRLELAAPASSAAGRSSASV